MSSVFATASRQENENHAFALLHIIESRGSTPRHSASMLVGEQGERVGTIGGGMMERMAIERALLAIAEERSQIFYGRLARQGQDAVGADCGGRMSIYIAVYPRRLSLFLLGGGHVNRALAQAALPLGLRVTIADTWPQNLAHPDLPAACQRVTGERFSDLIAELPLDENSYVIIATNHQDREALDAMIRRPVGYLGLLASRRKAHYFRELLKKEQDISEDELARLRSPVGLNIAAETPEEIAISILGEIVQHYRQRDRQPENNGLTDGDVPARHAAQATTAE